MDESESENAPVEAKSFLGTEFLTWLWAHERLNQGIYPGRVPATEQIEATLAGPFVLEAKHGSARRIGVAGDDPEGAPEAMKALYQGKRLARCKVRLRDMKNDARDWTFTLDGETMGISGLKLTKTGKMPMQDGLPLRIRDLGDCHEALRLVYEAFITLRFKLRPWKKELTEIRRWVGEAA